MPVYPQDDLNSKLPPDKAEFVSASISQMFIVKLKNIEWRRLWLDNFDPKIFPVK